MNSVILQEVTKGAEFWNQYLRFLCSLLLKYRICMSFL
jgi:hypothetical protein